MRNLLWRIIGVIGFCWCVLAGYAQRISDRAAVYEGECMADEGAWCWFADPRAIHYESPTGDINRSYIGYIDVHGNIKAVQYDFLSGERKEVLIRSYFQPDDHNNPTFLVLPDGRIMIFYSRHTDEPCFYYRISRIPGDVTVLGKEHKLVTKDNTTYPSPFILSDDPEHIYLCWRGINWHPTIARLTMPDENDNVEFDWGPYQMVQSSGARPYAKYQSNGKDKIMLTYTTGHPDNEQPNWLYFNYVNINTLQLEDVEGNVLSDIAAGPLRVNKTEEYLSKNSVTVVDHTPGMRDWVWQIVSDKNGYPVIAMVKISDDKASHDYYYVYWDGSKWESRFLVNGGGHFHQTSNIEKCYSAGMALDPVQPNVVYCSVPVNGAFGKMYESIKYTVNTGSGQIDTERITRHSRKNNVRPYILPGSEKSPLRLVWMHGDYYDWIVSNQRPGYPTAIYGDMIWPERPLALDSALICGNDLKTFVDEKDHLKIKVDKKWKNSAFTLAVRLSLASDSVGGLLCDGGKWAYGLDAESWKPYIQSDEEQYNSCNLLGSADSWLNYGRGTNGKWYPAERFKTFHLVLTYQNGRLVTYLNGLIDQVVDMKECPLGTIKIGGFEGSVSDCRLYHRALNQEEIEFLVSESHE